MVKFNNLIVDKFLDDLQKCGYQVVGSQQGYSQQNQHVTTIALQNEKSRRIIQLQVSTQSDTIDGVEYTKEDEQIDNEVGDGGDK